MRMRRFGFGATLFATALYGAVALSADANGDFAIKDAGAQTCGAFIRSYDKGASDVALYSGWIGGYVTGFNQFRDGAFDVSPWASTNTLLRMTRSVCGQLGDDVRFLDSVAMLLGRLKPTRLEFKAQLEGVGTGGKATFIYRPVLDAARAQLKKAGFGAGGLGKPFDQTTSDAFAAFQRKHYLPVTGIPDQETLFALFIGPPNG